MKIAFITEMGFAGKVPVDHPNMRTEFAWMHALDADHFNIHIAAVAKNLVDYDHVFIIFPKGEINYSTIGVKLGNASSPYSQLLASDWIERIKSRNKKVHFVQEGPHWLWNDYELVDQINFINLMMVCDSIFVHNESDIDYYKGLFIHKPIHVLPSLMINTLIKDITPKPEDKVFVGGNFARWYGGFESYLVADEFGVEKWGQESHAKRPGEDQMLKHLPRLMWNDWMKELSTFKYAVHLMPTVAAGTFSLNCAYYGIPCIGNIKVDTQKLCHPTTSVDIDNVHEARKIAVKLKRDKDFYEHCSKVAKENYNFYFSTNVWKEKMFKLLNETE